MSIPTPEVARPSRRRRRRTTGRRPTTPMLAWLLDRARREAEARRDHAKPVAERALRRIGGDAPAA